MSSTLNHEVSAAALQDAKREILCRLVVLFVLLPSLHTIYTHRCFKLVNATLNHGDCRWSVSTLWAFETPQVVQTKLFTSNIGLAAAVDSKFDREKLWNNWQQFPWTKKAVSRTAALLFDNNNACILKQNTNTARLCRFVFKGFKSGSGTTRLQDELDL